MKRLDKLLELVNNPKVIVDVGPCKGEEIDWFLDNFSDCKVYAFEPDKRSFDFLKNKYADIQRVSLYETAITQTEGMIPWFASYDEHPASSSSKKPTKHLEIWEDITFTESKVKSIRLDNWFKLQHIDLIDLLWVDANGGDGDVILSAGNIIEKYVKCLCIEFCEVELYEGAANLDRIKTLLPTFDFEGVYDFYGNYGNCVMTNGNL